MPCNERRRVYVMSERVFLGRMLTITLGVGMDAQQRIAEALRSLGYTCADVDMGEASTPAAPSSDVELTERGSATLPNINLREVLPLRRGRGLVELREQKRPAAQPTPAQRIDAAMKAIQEGR